ncbi:alpha/beta fold hydrolase [Bradyrhizobium paxllaeri]|uniref:alpha/beta fold hydrolase n=1 Tax=Bradyrhizobium paxllaeri TaxID=190148 RepID=UPI0008109B15|nr:alpha/beta fold hydrolase [Bradyrhizobium paxllaeri]
MLPYFSVVDLARKMVGDLLENAGHGPHETAWDRIESSAYRLRRYGQIAETKSPVLIVPAPIKRAYIFDLLPQVSVVQRLRSAGFAVYLYEWPEEQDAKWGLEACISSLCLATEMIATKHGAPPILVGHSLGGTLAAITAALEAQQIRKVVLIESPLKFGEQTGALRPIVFASPVLPLDTIPGTLLNLASIAADPKEFAFDRYGDACACLADQEALAIHLAVFRWSLDEFAPNAQLIQDVLQLLYREDRFARNELHLLGRSAQCDLLGNVAAIVDHTSRVVPSSSALGCLKAPSVFSYEPEIGVALQHVGPIVGRRAHEKVWPNVIDWMRAHL